MAAKIEGRQVTTMEGPAKGADFQPMQQALLDNDALQCGYCALPSRLEDALWKMRIR